MLDWNYISMTFRAGGVFIPFSMAIFLPHRLPGGWAVASMAISTAGAVASHFAFRNAINPLFVGLTISLLIVGVGMVAPGSPGRRAIGRSRTA